MNTFVKDPDAKLDYTVDWKPWLQTGETIVTSEWFVTLNKEPTTDVTTSDASHSGDGATVWLAGGRRCIEYMVTNRITTSSSPARINDQSFIVKIKDL